jgi:hypothetical protein
MIIDDQARHSLAPEIHDHTINSSGLENRPRRAAFPLPFGANQILSANRRTSKPSPAPRSEPRGRRRFECANVA